MPGYKLTISTALLDSLELSQPLLMKLQFSSKIATLTENESENDDTATSQTEDKNKQFV